MVLAERLPVAASKLERPLRLVFLLALVVLLVVLAPRLFRDVGSVYGSRGMFAMTCVVLLSIATGWLFGGPDERERRTLSIGTALRNIGLCALVATATFGATSRVASTVLVYLLIQAVLTGVLGVFFTRAAKAEAAVQEPVT
jgi:predicted Na+-dependent transporter